jgi:uncharacterized protein (UPF0179 family)
VDIEGDVLTVEVKETKAWIYLMSTRLLKGHVIVARREFCDVESVMEIWTILSRFQSRHREVNKDVRTVIRHYCNIGAIVPTLYTICCYYAKFKIADD